MKNITGDNMKKILITGARSGIIGDVIKKIKEDYILYVAVHTESELRAIKKIYKDYKNIKCMKLDLSLDEDINKLDQIDIDVLVCNGAVAESGSLLDIPFSNIRYNFEINFFSNLKIIKKVILKNENVKIVIVSSLAGKLPMPFLGSYSASKAALSQFIKALNWEAKLLNRKIDLCLVEPGLYSTGFNKLAFDKKYDFMDNESFFKSQIENIRKAENIYLYLFEKRCLNSISNKIVKAIKDENPRFYYRAPFSQVLFVKLYNILF